MNNIMKDSRLYILENEDIDIKSQLYRGDILDISIFTLNVSNEIHVKSLMDYLKPSNVLVFYGASYCHKEIIKLNNIIKETRGYKILLLDNNCIINEELSEFDVIIHLQGKDMLQQYSWAERISNTFFSILKDKCEVGMQIYEYDSIVDKSEFKGYFIQCKDNIENAFMEFIEENITDDINTAIVSFEGDVEKIGVIKIGELLELIEKNTQIGQEIYFTVIDCKHKYDYEVVILLK